MEKMKTYIFEGIGSGQVRRDPHAEYREAHVRVEITTTSRLHAQMIVWRQMAGIPEYKGVKSFHDPAS